MEDVAQEKQMGTLGRLWGVLVNPTETFRQVDRQPAVFVPSLILIVITVLLMVPVLPKIQEFTRISLEKNLPPGQGPEVVEFAVKAAAVGSLVGAAVGLLVMWLIVAALVKGFNSLTGGEGGFKNLFAVTVLAWVPVVILGGVFGTAMILATPAENLPFASASLSLLLPKEEFGSPLFVILSSVNLFQIWSLILLSIGASVVFNTSTRKQGIFIFIVYLLYTAGMAAYAAFTGGPKFPA